MPDETATPLLEAGEDLTVRTDQTSDTAERHSPATQPSTSTATELAAHRQRTAPVGVEMDAGTIDIRASSAGMIGAGSIALGTAGSGQRVVPPLARRPVVAPAAALREEINDSWRLLFGCVGATGAVTALLYTFTTLVG